MKGVGSRRAGFLSGFNGFAKLGDQDARKNCWSLSNPGSCCTSGDDESLSLQPLICLSGRAERDVEVSSGLPNGRQTVAGANPTGKDEASIVGSDFVRVVLSHVT